MLYTVIRIDNEGSVGTQYLGGQETTIVKLLSADIRREGFKSFAVFVESEESANDRA